MFDVWRNRSTSLILVSMSIRGKSRCQKCSTKNVQKKIQKTIDTVSLVCEIALTHGIKPYKNNRQKMRTKTLLIVAASALAAAVTSSQAQSTVYSQNIVGYVNEAISQNQYELFAPALDVDGTGTNGTISTVLGTNVDVGTSVLVWNGAGYDSLQYTSVGGHGGTVTWSLNGVADPNYPLNVGQGFFLYDPAAGVTNITETGVVMQGTLKNPYVGAANTYSLLGSEVPIGGDLTTNLNYIPSQGDSVLLWNGTGYTAYQYTSVGGHGGTVEWESGGVAAEPIINVGQGFFLYPAANTTWTQTFTNN